MQFRRLFPKYPFGSRKSAAWFYEKIWGILDTGDISKIIELIGSLFSIKIVDYKSGEDYVKSSIQQVEELNVQQDVLPQNLAVAGILKGIDASYSGMMISQNLRENEKYWICSHWLWGNFSCKALQIA